MRREAWNLCARVAHQLPAVHLENKILLINLNFTLFKTSSPLRGSQMAIDL
jgi:hypothetical protein